MKGKTTIKVTWFDDNFSVFDGLCTQIVPYLIGQYNVYNIVYSYDHSTKQNATYVTVAYHINTIIPCYFITEKPGAYK